jgi:hypothetical protein
MRTWRNTNYRLPESTNENETVVEVWEKRNNYILIIMEI